MLYNGIVFYLTATGCPSFDLPREAWMVRTGENMKIQCNNTGEVWYLTCREGEWIGDFGNCTGRVQIIVNY